MPLKMPVGKTDDYFIIGFDDAGKPGKSLQAGQVANVTSADPATVVITPDATVRATLADATVNGVLVPAGTQAIASGKVSAPASPAQLSTPILITSHLQNADGTPVLDDTGTAVVDITDTVEIDPTLLKSQGDFFGVPA